MPPKGKDAKGKGAKGGAPPPSTGTVTKKVLAPPDEAPMTAVAVAPPVYDPRTHAPPVVYGCFWDFPGRRPQVRPGTAPLARMTGGDPAGGAGGGGAAKKGKDAKGAKVRCSCEHVRAMDQQPDFRLLRCRAKTPRVRRRKSKRRPCQARGERW